MLEAAPEDESGGNSRFAGGVMRFAYDGVEDLKKVTDIPADEVKGVDWESNTTDEFYDDLYRVTSFRTDPQLSETLVTQSLDAMVWLRSQGARFAPNYRHQSAIVNGKRKFFGRMPLWVTGGGPGLVQSLTDTGGKKGVEDLLRNARGVADLRRRARAGRQSEKRRQAPSNSTRARWCSPAAASRPIPSGARATSAPAGNSRKCAARVSTWATA